MRYSFAVSIQRKPGLSDPEGTTTKKALIDLGFDGVTDVSFGRMISIDVEADDAQAARAALETMCEKLLANPVMEIYRIEATT
ncbi:MAG: phosphoribosylformylglycinamidine synthase subunit PurS [Acidimicrobiia bacterium]|nr:MAG: phosphoribosylformylglycinamidine synthase subunit PurS [Acidimicrobiia bacterium]